MKDLSTSEIGAVLAGLRISQDVGFLGPRPVEEQFDHAKGFAEVIRSLQAGDHGPISPFVHGVDLGTGGGLPGLVLAAMYPGISWVLLDAMERRMSVLRQTVSAPPWQANCECVTSRAEIWASGPGSNWADVVVSRSFGPPALVAECAAPMLAQDGWLIVSEPPATGGNSDAERWGGITDAGLGFASPTFIQFGGRFMVTRRAGAVERKLPRSPNAMQKRPLF
jgi:16S rRNA (guanine527-N7)-methyltransferase